MRTRGSCQPSWPARQSLQPSSTAQPAQHSIQICPEKSARRSQSIDGTSSERLRERVSIMHVWRTHIHANGLTPLPRHKFCHTGAELPKKADQFEAASPTRSPRRRQSEKKGSATIDRDSHLHLETKVITPARSCQKKRQAGAESCQSKSQFEICRNIIVAAQALKLTRTRKSLLRSTLYYEYTGAELPALPPRYRYS